MADPRITGFFESDDNLSEDSIVFQHDRALSHFALSVRQVLNENFPAFWKGRRGQMIECPPMSPE